MAARECSDTNDSSSPDSSSNINSDDDFFRRDGPAYDKARDIYYKYRDQFLVSNSWYHHQDALGNFIRTLIKRNRLTQCICFGLGSLVSEDTRLSSIPQLIFLELILDIFTGKLFSLFISYEEANEIIACGFGDIRLFAQDPCFREHDVKWLKRLVGFEVVTTPDAFLCIDASSFVYAPHLDMTLYS